MILYPAINIRETPVLKAVIFDMDGVIVDSEPLHFDAESIIFREMGITLPDSERHTFMGMSNRKMWSLLKERFGLPGDHDDIMFRAEETRLAFMTSLTDIPAVPGIHALLDDLENHRCPAALASSSSRKLISLFLSRIGMEGRFAAIVSGNEVHRGKPDPDIFLHTAELLRVKPADCAVIEDSTNGTRAAKAAGMTCIGYRNPNSPGQDLALADSVVDDIRLLNHEFLAGLFTGTGISHKQDGVL